MTANWRKLSLSLAAFALLAGLLIAVAWWSVHSQWFAGLVRARIVSALQKATHGRVELKSFRFYPEELRAGIAGLVVHGTEPAGSPPLLSVDSAEVGVKLLSIWRQDVDLQSVLVVRPRIFVLINPDGSSNIPAVKYTRNPVEQLLDLKVKHFEVAEGEMQINNRRIPFHFLSQNMGLLIDYGRNGPSYNFVFETKRMTVDLNGNALKPMQIAASGRVFGDHAEVQGLKLVTENSLSTIDLTGRVEHFAEPTATANVVAALSIDELAKLGNIDAQLRNGRATATGTARMDFQSGTFFFNGRAHASGVDFVSPGFALRQMSGAADLVADNDGIMLRHAEASARGAHFSGEGSIKAYRSLQVDGRVSNVALKEVGSYLTSQAFPWSGTAHGTAHASATLSRDSNLTIAAKVQIDGGQTGIPASGIVDLTYRLRDQDVEFGVSTLQLPHSSLTFQGTLSKDLMVKAETSDLADLTPALPLIGAQVRAADLPVFQNGGSAHFSGSLRNALHLGAIAGEAALTRFKFRSYEWDAFAGQFNLSAQELSVPHFQLQESGATLQGSGSAQLVNWSMPGNAAIHLNTSFSNLDVVKTAALFNKVSLPVNRGIGSGKANLQGSLENLHGTGSFQIKNLDAYGELLNQMQFEASVEGDRVSVSQGRVRSGPALLVFSGSYRRRAPDWSVGDMEFRADTNGFPLSSLSSVRKFAPAWDAHAEVHMQATGKMLGNRFEPSRINGDAEFLQVTVNGRPIGRASLKAITNRQSIDFQYSGDLSETKFRGAAKATLASGTPVRGDIQVDRIALATLKALAFGAPPALPLDGFLEGGVSFDGPLEEPQRMHAQAIIRQLQVSTLPQVSAARATTPEIVLHNNEPIVLDVAAGMLKVTKFEIDGRDTSLKVMGSVSLLNDRQINVKAVGTADLGLFALFDPSIHSSGGSELAASVTGTLASPNVTGALQLRNGSFFLSDISNGLSDVNGSLIFGRNRATIQKMSARSGGGDLSLGGTIGFSAGSPLVYHLEAQARNVRVRYGNSISITANSNLRLSGTSASSILSGTLTVTRVVFTPNADAGNLLAAATSSASSPSDQQSFISGIHLDVGVESAPNLQVSTNLSRDVEAEIQLSLRGTPDHPIVLGNIAANQGDIKIFGTRFSLNRGEVSFVNAVRVEPVLDLDLETQARGVTVDITVSGTPGKLNFNYRSDPPLQPRDILALLTVGRAPDLGTTNNAQTGSDVSALKSGVNSVLGQAISPVSNRLSKLFGITNIKIDPFVQGITNTPQARLSVEQQISRDVTITYVTNLSQTSEQIFRFEWALNRQFSIVALRDDNGEFGIDFQYKKRFK